METFIQEALFSQQLSLGLILAVFLTGVLTSFTPCVYPMLPITVAIVGRQATNRLQAFVFSLIYAMGLATAYAGLGLLAAMSGSLFGSVASHPIMLGGVGMALLLMAAWMAGWVVLPAWSLNSSFGYGRFRWVSLFVLGAVSGLVMAPCTSPVLGMLLMFVAAQGDPAWGAAMMFVFAFGMSGLLILAGTFTSLLAGLPKSGAWMNTIKFIFAALMAGVGSYFLYLSLF